MSELSTIQGRSRRKTTPTTAMQSYSRNYNLNKMKALEKKAMNTDIPLIHMMERHNNIVLTMHTGMYEHFKSTLSTFFQNYQRKNFEVAFKEITDKANHNVETQIKVSKTGMKESYSINAYHTTNRILVNGSLYHLFHEDMKNLTPLLDMKQVNATNTRFKSMLSNPKRKDKLYMVEEQDPRAIPDSEPPIPTDDYIICSVCGEPINEENKSIGCDICMGWSHLDCEALRTEDIKAEDYTCLLCIATDEEETVSSKKIIPTIYHRTTEAATLQLI